MTIILVVYNCDLFVVFINLIDTGTEKQIKLLTLHPENGVNASNKINYWRAKYFKVQEVCDLSKVK